MFVRARFVQMQGEHAGRYTRCCGACRIVNTSRRGVPEAVPARRGRRGGYTRNVAFVAFCCTQARGLIIALELSSHPPADQFVPPPASGHALRDGAGLVGGVLSGQCSLSAASRSVVSRVCNMRPGGRLVPGPDHCTPVGPTRSDVPARFASWFHRRLCGRCGAPAGP